MRGGPPGGGARWAGPLVIGFAPPVAMPSQGMRRPHIVQAMMQTGYRCRGGPRAHDQTDGSHVLPGGAAVRGFTRVEAMVVMSIVAILIVVAMASSQQQSRRRVQASNPIRGNLMSPSKQRSVRAAPDAGHATAGIAGNSLGRRARASRGFTLVEVVVVVAIVGILAAIAIPSYNEYVRRSQRAEARTVLLEAAQFMQRFYSANDRYDAARSGAAVTLPAGLQRVPATGAARYTISLNAVSTTAFTLQAAPGGSMAGDKCGTFTLSSVGRKDVVGATVSAADCWR